MGVRYPIKGECSHSNLREVYGMAYCEDCEKTIYGDEEE